MNQKANSLNHIQKWGQSNIHSAAHAITQPFTNIYGQPHQLKIWSNRLHKLSQTFNHSAGQPNCQPVNRPNNDPNIRRSNSHRNKTIIGKPIRNQSIVHALTRWQSPTHFLTHSVKHTLTHTRTQALQRNKIRLTHIHKYSRSQSDRQAISQSVSDANADSPKHALT